MKYKSGHIRILLLCAILSPVPLWAQGAEQVTGLGKTLLLWFALFLVTLVLTVVNVVQKNRLLSGITAGAGVLIIIRMLLAEEFGLLSLLDGGMGLAALISTGYVYRKTKK